MEEICPKKASEDMSEIMLNVSIKMKDKRKVMNINQSELAYRIGSDKSIISGLETGAKSTVNLYTLVKISQALGISVVELIS